MLTTPAVESYPAQLRALLGIGWEYLNFGVGGQTTLQMIADAAAQIDVLYDSARPRNVVVAWEGGNDMSAGATVQEAHDNLATYCNGRRAAGFYVVICTLTADNAALNSALVADWPTFADGIARLDLNVHIGAGCNTADTDYFIDGVHLTAAGYAIVAALVNTAMGY